MPTTPSPPLPQTCAPPSQPSTHCRPFSQERAHQSQARPTPANLAPTNPRQPATGPEQPALRPASLAPARLTPSQAYPANPSQSCLSQVTVQDYPRPGPRLFTDTDISSIAYKTPCNFYREGTILPVNTNIPGTHQGAPGISVKDQSVHLMILVTRPEPTVRPPSRIAKPRPSSMAMGWIS